MLNGKKAIVTGSTSGIGLGIARALAAQGADVLLNGFGERRDIDALVAELAERYKVAAAYSAADMSKPVEVVGMVADAATRFGSVDILVNNAGIQHVAAVEEFPPERWDAVLAVNLSAPFHAIRAALPLMKSKNWGRIVNIASVHGLVASAGKAAYVAAKHGLVGLTKVVALETARTGITCNAICPGWVETPIVRRQIEERAAREGVSTEQAQAGLLAEKQPSLAFATPEQIGALAVFLCSPAADQMRGAAVNVDGGWVAQ
jgi:3-hydroxybutyrate dehydrogenase